MQRANTFCVLSLSLSLFLARSLYSDGSRKFLELFEICVKCVQSKSLENKNSETLDIFLIVFVYLNDMSGSESR